MSQPSSGAPLLPDVSVVVVSDFEAGTKTWKDEIAMARHLAEQDAGFQFQLMFVESEQHRSVAPPEAITAVFPGARIVYHDSSSSAAMKDYGISLCRTEWVAVLEADAMPAHDWLRSLLDAAVAHPGHDVITGRTNYGTGTSWRRALNVLDRSFDDHGCSQQTYHISNNGALYRTEVLRRFQYPHADTPFLSSRLRSELIFAAGYKAWFERAAVTRHAIGGVPFVFDFRRHTGFADMMAGDSQSIGKIPRTMAQRMRRELDGMRRVHRDYLRWYDWPLVAALFCFVRLPEMLGMFEALQKRPLVDTAYR